MYNNLDVSFESFPADDKIDDKAYKAAIDGLQPGDAVTIFTPDPTHYPIALYAIERGIHVLVTKPAVKKLHEHQELLQQARQRGVFVFVEHHKRFDPAYSDARFRARSLGDFGYFYGYMSQPKYQLATFRSWAGSQSDISYYLNSHHVDVCDSMVRPLGYRPVRVTASSSRGLAVDLGCVQGTEDTISLMVTWERPGEADRQALSVFTASWTAPRHAGVHTSQHFHYLASGGELRVDQARRGYELVDEAAGQSQSLNPFYMSYAPGPDGNFAGQTGYGYQSIEAFVNGCRALNAGQVSLEALEAMDMPALANTLATTAILEAGRRSLDEGRRVEIVVTDAGKWELR